MQTFDNRVEMLSTLPHGLIISEIGVFKGDFAKKILEICKPEKLILIDNWDGLTQGSGDADGNNYEKHRSHDLHTMVTNDFKDIKNVKIFRETSTVLESFPDDYFDMIYIDADHTYGGVKIDLWNAYRKVKNGGYIMGHDYGQNMKKTKHKYTFGVKQAVTEFCINKKQEVSMLAMDGCISYGIKLNK